MQIGEFWSLDNWLQTCQHIGVSRGNTDAYTNQVMAYKWLHSSKGLKRFLLLFYQFEKYDYHKRLTKYKLAEEVLLERDGNYRKVPYRSSFFILFIVFCLHRRFDETSESRLVFKHDYILIIICWVSGIRILLRMVNVYEEHLMLRWKRWKSSPWQDLSQLSIMK